MSDTKTPPKKTPVPVSQNPCPKRTDFVNKTIDKLKNRKKVKK